MNSLTLYDIESKLAELLAIEASIFEDEEINEDDRALALASINKEIEAYFAREVKKVDNIANAIRAFQSASTDAAREADRMFKRAAKLQRVADRIKDNAIAAMQAHGIKRVETPTNVLRIQGNGGLAPLVIDDPAKLPLGLKVATMKLPGDTLAWLTRVIGEMDGAPAALSFILRAEHTLEPDNERIRAAITEGEEVPAHLGERGQHLRLG